MSDYGILFSAPMIRALLRPVDPKTVTRRMSDRWLKVKTGDRLWVRESWRAGKTFDHDPAKIIIAKAVEHGWKPTVGPVWFEADGSYRQWSDSDDADFQGKGKLRPSIFMPRCASRITLEATEDARREPLAHISEADAKAEGITWDEAIAFGGDDNAGAPDYVAAFFRLWDSINGKTAPVSSKPAPVRLAFRRVPA